MKRHWETHLYTYAAMLTQGDKIKPDNLAAVRAKAIKHGHTEGECLCVERGPQHWIETGEYAKRKSAETFVVLLYDMGPNYAGPQPRHQFNVQDERNDDWLDALKQRATDYVYISCEWNYDIFTQIYEKWVTERTTGQLALAL